MTDPARIVIPHMQLILHVRLILQLQLILHIFTCRILSSWSMCLARREAGSSTADRLCSDEDAIGKPQTDGICSTQARCGACAFGLMWSRQPSRCLTTSTMKSMQSSAARSAADRILQSARKISSYSDEENYRSTQ